MTEYPVPTIADANSEFTRQHTIIPHIANIGALPDDRIPACYKAPGVNRRLYGAAVDNQTEEVTTLVHGKYPWLAPLGFNNFLTVLYDEETPIQYCLRYTP